MKNQEDQNNIAFFGQTYFRNRPARFGIKEDDRRRHIYIIGKTGMGKSTLLENLIIDDIRAGRGVAVTDPHGDLVEKILDFVPSNRINDVVYFNPADAEYPIAFNILENTNPQYKNLIAQGLVGVFKKIWADSWGPRLEYILMNSILALLENQGTTLLALPRLLVDKKFRRKIVENVKDPVVRSFWVDEYANYNEKFRSEAIAPIQNKIGQFLSSALIRNIISQPKSTIDVREIMDSKKILLMNLAKGRIGEENAALLGAMMITRLQLAAMSRVDIPEVERKDFYLYVDEFQNFATESFANILSEARKYRLNLVIAHQYMEQLGEVVKPAVLGNVGTMVIFRIGAADAEELETEFDPQYTPTDMVNLPKYHIYIKLMIDGVTSEPFSATTLPPFEKTESFRSTIIEVSRQKYANGRKEVEEMIARWAGITEETKLADDFEEKKVSPAKIRPGNTIVAGGIPANARRVMTTPPPPETETAPAPKAVTPITFGGNFNRSTFPEASIQTKREEEEETPKDRTQTVPVRIPMPTPEKATVTEPEMNTIAIKKQDPDDDFEKKKKEEVRLEKIKHFVQTGKPITLSEAMHRPVVGFNGRELRNQPNQVRGREDRANSNIIRPRRPFTRFGNQGFHGQRKSEIGPRTPASNS